jgi:hypothetical protein
MMRFESKRHDRCPQCGSYQTGYGYIPDMKEYALHCDKCGWDNLNGRRRVAE